MVFPFSALLIHKLSEVGKDSVKNMYKGRDGPSGNKVEACCQGHDKRVRDEKRIYKGRKATGRNIINA